MNHFSRKHKVLILLVLIVGLFSTIGSGQIQIHGVVYDSETKKPIIGATILESVNGKGVISDSIGQFSLRIKELPTTIDISHLSYYKITNFFVKNELIEILMIPKSFDVGEAVVYGNLVERISNRSEFNLLDYGIVGGKAILAGFEDSFNKGSLQMIDLNTKKILVETRVDRPLELCNDYLGNLHLITRDSIYQLFCPDSIYLLYGSKNEPKKKELFSFISTLNNHTIQKKANPSRQYFTVLAIDNKTFNTQLIYESFDSGLFQTARQASNFKMWSFKGRGKVSPDPGPTNKVFEVFSYDKNVKYRQRKLHVEVVDSSIVIFDPNNWKLVNINSEFETEKTIDLPFKDSRMNKNGLTKDELTGKIYLYNSNWGSAKIYLLNLDTFEITEIASFEGFSNIQKPIVYDSKVYFMYIEKTYPQVNSLFSRKLLVE